MSLTPWDYNLRTHTRILVKRQEVPFGHTPSNYHVRRVEATANDGETIPISILYKAGTPLDGSAPCFLYGYGSYGHAVPVGFSTNRLSLADRGFVYAIAHVRGGTEKGWNWYQTGKLAKKTNTFLDFIACAEHLVAQKLVANDKIIAYGGSAGGMLMGAIANLAPHLFCGIVADVPFVDVLNTILDETLPLTPPEWPEWGNPIEDKAAYETIAAYSPYDNVTAQAYPALFVIAGLTDPRVTYWEPAKWVAKLRAHTTSTAPILLETNMGAGHGGASGRFEALRETARVYAFALKITKIVSA
jgi:oligopeptidase B